MGLPYLRRIGWSGSNTVTTVKVAVIYGNWATEVLRYEDVPDLERPDGCVLIDVEAISWR
jgi:hypothetical protein